MLTPITSPAVETKGPPELPGLRAASVRPRFVVPCARQAFAQGRYDANRHTRFKTQGIADRQHQMTALEPTRIAEPRCG